MGLLSQLSDQLSNRVSPFRRRHYRARQQYRGNYVKLAEALSEVIDFDTLLDVGCGQGLLLEPLLHLHDKDVHGVELSDSALPFLHASLRDRVRFVDASTLHSAGTKYDVVSCIEVAEHLPSQRADELIAYLTQSSRRAVYFTAAIPRQPGHGHINCQPSFYWIDLFDRNGFSLDVERTRGLRERIVAMKPCYWIPQNSLIFTPTM